MNVCTCKKIIFINNFIIIIHFICLYYIYLNYIYLIIIIYSQYDIYMYVIVCK